MFSFLTKLFTESGFYDIVNQQINSLTSAEGPFALIYDGKGETVYQYNGFTDSDQSLDPNYEEYKKSCITVYDDPKDTVNKNLGEKMLEKHLKQEFLILMQQDFEHLQSAIEIAFGKDKEIGFLVNAAVYDISYFKSQYLENKKLKGWPYILEYLLEMVRWLNSKWGHLVKSQSPSKVNNAQRLKWTGSLPQLCSLFYFASKEHHAEAKVNFYFDAPRKEIEEFIFQNFTDSQGIPFIKEHITKCFNPINTNRRSSDVKKHLKKNITDSSESTD